MQILVICGDPVLALDLEMFLNGNGYLPVMTENGSRQLPGPQALQGFASAIVNVDRLDDDSRTMFERLEAERIPVIAVSSIEGISPDDVPSVVAWHSKPLSVDALLPDVQSATAARRASTPPPAPRS